MKYYCPNCDSYYTETEIMFNGWISYWCPLCFRLGENISDCKLIEEEN